MVEGTLIAESIRIGAELDGVRFVVRKIRRAAQGEGPAGRADVWTLIEFEAEEQDGGALADALAGAMEERDGWYADFRTPEETFVVYSGKVFRYRRGDSAGRAEAEAYGRSKGVPENELDWPV